jgi:hypothetical protein
MRNVFDPFCSFITGFSVLELQGTGLLDTYRTLIEQVLGEQLSPDLYGHMRSVITAETQAARDQQFTSLITSSEVLWPVVSRLISLWYLGTWVILPGDWYQTQGLPLPGGQDAGRTHVPCQAAYVEQLSYRAAKAHAPGSNPTGFGSWSVSPF